MGQSRGEDVYGDAGQDGSGCGLIGRDWIWGIFVLDFGRAFEFVLAPGLGAAKIHLYGGDFLLYRTFTCSSVLIKSNFASAFDICATATWAVRLFPLSPRLHIVSGGAWC